MLKGHCSHKSAMCQSLRLCLNCHWTKCKTISTDQSRLLSSFNLIGNQLHSTPLSPLFHHGERVTIVPLFMIISVLSFSFGTMQFIEEAPWCLKKLNISNVVKFCRYATAISVFYCMHLTYALENCSLFGVLYSPSECNVMSACHPTHNKWSTTVLMHQDRLQSLTTQWIAE